MKKLTKVIMSGAAVAAIGCGMAVGFTGCAGGPEITIEGSTSMEDVMTALAERYEQIYQEENGEELTIIPAFTGSGSGITAATDGRVDIGLSSRPLSSSEAEHLESQTICLDGISVVVNPSSNLTSVTKTQLVDLYTKGTAIDSVIAALRREPGSGTRDGFQDALGIEDEQLCTNQGFDEYNSTGALKEAIAGNTAGTMLGYISMGSVDSTVKALAYEDEDPDNGTGAAAPTDENVLNGSYGLSRPFVICYQSYEGLSDLAKGFIEFILSAEGQQICEEEGCISEILAENN